MKHISNRILELESLRGIAALSVLYYHYTYFFRRKLNYAFSDLLDFEFGHHGVALFFIISGFVIFMSLDRISSIREFLYKRFVRLYPTYWICLLITLLVLLFNNTNEFNFTFKEKLLNILMFQGLFNIKNVDGSYWSLLPELFFYITMIVLWKFKLTKKIILVSFVWILLMYLALFRPSAIDIVLNLKFGVFFIIGIMFNLLSKEKFFFYPHVIILLALVSVLIIRKNTEAFIFTAIFVLLFYLLIYKKLSFLNNRFLIFFGQISYPLYLLHQTIGFILISNLIDFGLPHYLSVLLTLILNVGLSYLVYEYLEKPIIKKIK